MAASVEYREEEMSFGVIKEKENDDDPLLFVELTDESQLNLHQKSEQFRDSLDSEPGKPLISKPTPMIHVQEPGADDLLSSGNNSTDYDWLLSPPRNALSAEVEAQKALTNQSKSSTGQPTAQNSRLEKPPPTRNISMANVAPRHPTSSNGVRSSSSRRPSPSRKAPPTGSRPATPTARPSLPSATKPLKTSTTVASTKPVAPPKRSSTPTRSSARSNSTPRPSLITAPKSTSRSSTPTQRPSNPSMNGVRSSSASKTRVPILKSQPPSRGNSPSVKSRPSAPERPISASKGRPAMPSVKTPSIETNSKPIPKRTSCSPSRGQISNGNPNNIVRPKTRGNSNGNDDVNPVLMGTKMVERVVNMRKLAPPKQDEHLPNQNSSGKSGSSQDSGFGRSLSKKSFDMALRHLDIRRSMPGNMRAMITKVPASSVYSVRSESRKSNTVNTSDSPLTTSSNTSSELSFNNSGSYIDDNDLGSENGQFYPSDHHLH